MDESNKKLTIIYVLEILKEYSDESHPLTQQEIIDKIHLLYGVDCERKSIASSIESLIEFGYEIEKIPHKGAYLSERILEPSEASFIVDALFTSRSINGKQAQDLAKKISQLMSVHQRKKYNYIYKADQISRSENKQLFYNIDLIQEAIRKNKQIKFMYKHLYYEKKNRDWPYKVNPYFLINSQGRYYLVCNYDYFDTVSNYKLDLISDIEILETERKPITNLKGYEDGLDIAKYANEHLYAFGGKSVNALLYLKNENAASYINEWFLNNAKIFKKEDKLYANIETNEEGLIFWCLQYGKFVELISPQETRNKIRDIIDEMAKAYHEEKKDFSL